jgi:hypothetical protein
VAAEGEALRELYVRFEAKVEGAEQLDKLDATATKAAKSVGAASDKVDKAGKGGGEGIKAIGALFSGLVAAVAGSSLVTGIGAIAGELSDLGKFAAQTGIASQDIEFFSFVVAQAGGHAGDFRTQLGFLQRSMTQLEKSASPQSEAFKALGIETQGVNQQTRSLGEIMPEVFKNFEKVKDPAEQAAIATRLFGKSGLALLPVLRQGEKGFEKYRESFEAAGGADSAEDIKKAQDYKKAIGQLGATWGNLREDLVIGVLPALTEVTRLLSKGTQEVMKFLKSTTFAEHSIVAIGAAITAALGGALKPYLAKGLKLAGIYLAVDDLLAFLRGKQSVIGDFIDGIWGEGSSAAVQAWVADCVDQFMYFVGNVDGAYLTMGDANATWVQKTLAGVALLTNGSVNTFAAISEGWASILLDMTIAIDEFVLGVSRKWDDMIGSLGLPKAVTDFLQGEGKGKSSLVNEEGLAARKAERNDLDAKAYERETGTGRFADTEMGKKARERNVEKAGYDGLTSSQRQANLDAQRNGAPAPFERRASTAAGRALQAQTATLREGAAAGATATLNDNKTLTINFKAGTPEETKNLVKQAVADAMKDDNRVALELLTQRGAPKK